MCFTPNGTIIRYNAIAHSAFLHLAGHVNLQRANGLLIAAFSGEQCRHVVRCRQMTRHRHRGRAADGWKRENQLVARVIFLLSTRAGCRRRGTLHHSIVLECERGVLS